MLRANICTKPGVWNCAIKLLTFWSYAEEMTVFNSTIFIRYKNSQPLNWKEHDNTLMPAHNGCHFADDGFMCISLEINVCNMVKILLSLILRVDKSTVINVWCLGTAQATRHYILTNSEPAHSQNSISYPTSYRTPRISWWRHQMETFSALLALCAGNSPVHGEFPTQRPVTRSFDVFLDLRLNKRLSK